MRLLKLLVAIVLCLNITLVAFAHPGRTDSSGGHYNNSTGEYHYHHGEPAHQHTDTNGDGILECPYRINGSLGTPINDSNSSIIRNDPPKTEEASQKEQYETAKSSKKQKVSIEVIMVSICAILIGVGAVADWITAAVKKSKR